MRLILRNYEQLSYRFKKNSYARPYTQNQERSEGTPQNSNYSNKFHNRKRGYNPNYKNYRKPQQTQTVPIVEQEIDEEWLQLRNQEMQTLNQPTPGSLKLEGTWQFVADSIVLKDYDYLTPLNKKDTSQQLIKKYENNLKLNMEKHLMPKLYEDEKYIRRMAKYHASEVGPLTASFLRQGYNFLDKKLIIHLLTTENIKTIKQLFLGGAFQTAECIDDEVVVHLLARFQQHQRNHFLINLLPFHVQLMTGEIRIDNAKTFEQQVAQEVNQRQFFTIMYRSNGSNSINKLRVLWSLQRRFLHKYNLMEFIVPQLKKITFLTKNPETQIFANKEVNLVVNTLFQSQVFEDIFFKLLESTKTFPNFFKAWSFTVLLLSKLRSIPRILDDNGSKQLHSIFQLIEMNLPKDIADQFMRATFFDILLFEEHNTISMQNYYKCLQHWQVDYVQPQTTLYNSPLTPIFSQNSPTITVTYRQHDKANQFATTTVVLNRKKVEERPAIITQSEVIHNLLKGNYQSVFDDFLVRYSLPSDFDTATKFQMKLKEADKNLRFNSKDQEALYKLKLAYNFFFLESLPKPLKKQDLQAYKLNLGVASNLDNALFSGKQILDEDDYNQVQEFRAKTDRYYQQTIDNMLYQQQQNKKAQATQQVEQREEEQSEQEIEQSSELSQSQEFQEVVEDVEGRQVQEVEGQQGEEVEGREVEEVEGQEGEEVEGREVQESQSQQAEEFEGREVEEVQGQENEDIEGRESEEMQDQEVEEGESQQQVEASQEQHESQDYLDMIRTEKDQDIDKDILYLNDEIALMLEELVNDQFISRDYFHQLRQLPKPQRIEEIRNLVKRYNEYYIQKLNQQTEQVQRQEFEQDQMLHEMGIDTVEKRRQYQDQRLQQTKAELWQEIQALKRQILQIMDQNISEQEILAAVQECQLDSEDKAQLQGLGEENAQVEQGEHQRDQNQIQMNQDNEQVLDEVSMSVNVDVEIDVAYPVQSQQQLAQLQQTEESDDINNLLEFKELQRLQDKILDGQDEEQFIDNEYDNMVSRIVESQENESEETQIDGARDDRAIYFAKTFHQIQQMEKLNSNEGQNKEIAPIELEQQNQMEQQQVAEGQEEVQAQVEGQQVAAEAENVPQNAQEEVQAAVQINSKQDQLKEMQRQFEYIANDLIDFMQPIEYFEQEAPLEDLINIAQGIMYKELKEIQNDGRFQQESQDESEDQEDNNNNRGWRKQSKPLFSRQNRNTQQPAAVEEPKKKREIGFFKKIKSGFCTINNGTQEKATVPVNNLFDLQNIQKYRTEKVSRQFYSLMQMQSHIPRIGDGNIVAKYLFLQGRRDGAKSHVDPKKIMTIQFSTVVGTRSKSYEKYIRSTLYDYELEDGFYKSLLEDQLKFYNRNEFKMIVAHIIHYKNIISDELISLICDIAENHLIGYSLVEIAQFIKANGIKLSPEALEKITKVWQRFDIINEDLLPFIKEYCAKVDTPFKTQYYSHFCRSLIVTQKFEKLQALCDLVFAEIRPKPFKVSNPAVSASELEALQKAWKQKQHEQFIRLYLELLEVIVMNLDTNKVPEFVSQLYEDYIKLRTELNQRQLGYGMVCFCLKKDKFQQLLVYLEKHPNLGTSFMYDCTLQALLSNFEELQELAERILEASVIRNRIVLTNEQILKSMNIFKRAATSNAFSKFLEHTLRFQVDIDKQQDIKKQMFYVLNHNVEEVSVAGIFNLLDFIFSEKREKERIEYRALMLAEQQKEKKLSEIQKQAQKNLETKGKYSEKVKGEKKEEKKKETQVKQQALDTNASQNSAKSGLSKKKAEKAEKKLKKQKIQKKISMNQMVDQILSEQQSLATQANQQQFSTSLNDDDIVNTIRGQTKKHESYKRKGVRNFGQIYESVIQGLEAQEAALRQKEEKAKMGAKEEKTSKKGAKAKGKEKK